MADSYTIQISTKLVDRLSGDGDKLKKKTKKSKPKIPQEPQQPQNKVKTASDSPKRSTASAGWSLQPPLYFPASQPLPAVANAELEAIRALLQESERRVERFQKQEADMVQELTERAKELHDKEFKLPHQKPKPCLVEEKACLECYKEHAKDILRCEPFVMAYADCARKARQQVRSQSEK